MENTAVNAPFASVRVVMQISEMHRFSPSYTKFASKEEINKESDGVHLYWLTKLGLIRLLAEVGSPQTFEVSEFFGPLGKIVDKLSPLGGKSAEEDAEANLWAAVSTDINQSNWKNYQGKYFSEP